jgi:hypothetical protein
VHLSLVYIVRLRKSEWWLVTLSYTLYLFIMKPTRCTNFTNLLRHETLHVSGSSSAHHQEFIHCKLGTGICHTAFEQDQEGTVVPSWACSKAVFKSVWHIPVPNVQWINSWWWAEEMPETCRVSWQNKFGKLVHLVGFIIKKFVTMHGHMSRCTVTWAYNCTLYIYVFIYLCRLKRGLLC